MINTADINHIFPNIGEARGVSDRILRRMRVKKIGRSSDFTTGQVFDARARIQIPLNRDVGSRVKAGFSDIVLCTSFTQRGDSGAAVLSDSNDVIGLVMAGSHKVTAVCRIMPIFKTLGLRLWRPTA
jgi:hypothetical protein